MLGISQPVSVLPEAAQNLINEFSRAEAAIVAATAQEGATNFRSSSASSSPQEAEKPYRLNAESGAAVIPVSGTLIAKKTPCMKQYPDLFNVTACDELRAAIAAALADERVSVICFDFDSPGGQVLGIPEAAGTILAARDAKPCIAFSAGLMCSAAYWLAAQCDAVFASPSATVGSIGVFMAFLDTSRRLEANGYRMELFSTGKYKGAGVTGTLTPAQRERYQEQVEALFAEFKEALSPRGIPPEAMQGQTFFGAEASRFRLVDGFALDPEQAIRFFNGVKK